jgi:lycopene cyclase domain-containing protein
MTYFAFLSYFVILPALALTLFARPTRKEWTAVGLLLVIVYVWTTPWDNYLVGSGVWYYDPRLVSGIVFGWVPLEEYLFFGCLTWLTSMWVFSLQRILVERPARQAAPRLVLLSAAVPALIWLTLWMLNIPSQPPAGVPATDLAPLPFGPWNYLVLILVWAGPVIIGQAWLGWPALREQKLVYVLGFSVPAIYLTLLDSLAIGSGTWTIAAAQSLNIFLPFGVPLEEGVFFLCANLLVVQGVFLFTSSLVEQRLRQWLQPK